MDWRLALNEGGKAPYFRFRAAVQQVYWVYLLHQGGGGGDHGHRPGQPAVPLRAAAHVAAVVRLAGEAGAEPAPAPQVGRPPPADGGIGQAGERIPAR